MEDTANRIWLPIIPFVVIAGNAGVYPVVMGVCTTSRIRLEMVNGEFPTCVYFSGAAVCATELIQGSQCITFRTAHQGSLCVGDASISVNTSA